MTYNYKQEYKKWLLRKRQEESTLKKLNVPQFIIDELRDYDYTQFKAERRYKSKHLIFEDSFFINKPSHNRKVYQTMEDLLDDIENEVLFDFLSHCEQNILQVVFLKMQGYSTKEISKITGLTTHQIYKKIKKIKKILK